MEYKIAHRIQSVLNSDKISDPQTLCQVLRDEIKPIVENYLSLSKDFKVRFKKEEERNIFFIELEADRVKPFGYIPR